jgi:formyltetrahydrofolate deformylase
MLEATLLLSCQDRPGLVADISRRLFDLGTNITHADQHLDRHATRFFQRIQFETSEQTRQALTVQIAEACQALGMTYSLHFNDQKKKVAILVSKQDHCLYDLLLRYRADELPCELTCIVSNHPDAIRAAAMFGVPFYHLPVTKETKPHQESQMLALLAQHQIDLVILARYMQIISADFLRQLARPVINIHHGFLPAFIGEKPYHRAHERGVKLIGATAHYVTEELDAGPIIEQDVVRTSHGDQVEDLIRKGRDVERVVLAHAVRLHLQDRVLVYKNKTVIFS